ncbi:MAG: hypothetical protein ABI251_09200 [Mycobacteriaceae bacterium]
MDLLTQVDLADLATPTPSEVHISLFIPTHRYGTETKTDPIRWKNLLSRVEHTLSKRGMTTEEIAELLAPAWQLHEDQLAWQYMSDGLAMYLRPGWHRMFRVPVEVPDVATIGDRFVVGPLVGIVTGDAHFLVLAVSQRRVRLLEGSMQRVEELEIADVPTSLKDVMEAPEARSNTMTFPVSSGSRGGGTAVFYGHGTADDDFKQNQVQSFLRQVADGLQGVLGGQNLPMVLVGLDQMVSLYRDVNTYPHTLDEDVRKNPDELSAEELHSAAWPQVEVTLAAARASAVERFEAQHGTGLAVDDPAKIEEAAGHQRVDTLILPTEPCCWEHLGQVAAVVELGRDETFAHCELLDRAVVNTLAGGGRVHVVPTAEVPGRGDAAAILRY